MVDPVPVTPVILILLPTNNPWALPVVTVTKPGNVVTIPAIALIDFASWPRNAIPFPVV